MGDIDVWFSARLLVDCHGQAASREADLRLADFELDGDLEAVQVWTSIQRAVVALTHLPLHGASPR